jgi:peptide chain release factor 1
MLIDELKKREERFRELETELSKPEAVRDLARFKALGKEHNGLKEIMPVAAEYQKTSRDLEEHRALIKSGEDRELTDLARAELPGLEKRLVELEENLRFLLVPRDENDPKSAIMEIRAGTGGEEAALFVSDLFRLYTRFAENRHWKIDVMNTSPADMGGLKEVIFLIEGKDVYGELKYENGVHRVQRVPKTEAQGRIHTSAASVIVMPEADDVEIDINSADLRIDVFRSSGPGGQNVNKTESAVRITHLPTGVTVSCQDEKSQHKNKAKALKILKSRILDAEIEKKNKEMSVERKKIVGTGDRSEKIRTYNFPQNRVTDHRLSEGAKNYPLNRLIEGEIEGLIEALKKESINEKLKEN